MCVFVGFSEWLVSQCKDYITMMCNTSAQTLPLHLEFVIMYVCCTLFSRGKEVACVLFVAFHPLCSHSIEFCNMLRVHHAYSVVHTMSLSAHA